MANGETLTDLADVYEKSPDEITPVDIEEIIRRQRAAFAAFTAGQANAGTSKTKKQQKKGADLDLTELGL